MADFSSQFDRFTENAKRSLENAETIATQMGSSYVGTEHILLGVLQQETSIGAKILKNVGVTFEKAQLVLSFSATRARLRQPSALSHIHCVWPRNLGSPIAAPSIYYLRF
jgi:ATP-dependent Clp protease ATP-binding subunit ClpA